MKRLIAFAHAPDNPACRFRIGQYVPCFTQAGWQVSLRTMHPPDPWRSPLAQPLGAVHRALRQGSRTLWRRWDIRAAARYDAVLLNRDLLGGRVAYERALLRRNPRVVFDFDDAIFLDGKAAHTEWICRRAAWVTAGNDNLASFARQFTDRVTVLPTVVDPDAYVVREATRIPDLARVGWLGSGYSIRQTLYPHLPMLARLQETLGFELVVVSSPRPDINVPGLRWRFVEWSAEVETRVGDLCDVGIMPLVDEPYQRAKCGCKLLQYMAAGLPVVASPVGINADLVSHGGRGYLASTEDEWRQAIETLLADPLLRTRMGREGRRFVERDYSRRRWFPVLLETLERVASDPRGAPIRA